MKREAIGKCPVCNHEMDITKLHCSYCETTIQGKFTLCKFCRLTEDQKISLRFLLKTEVI